MLYTNCALLEINIQICIISIIIINNTVYLSRLLTLSHF